MSLKVFYRVRVAGTDISSVLSPILISLSVSDKSGRSSDTASIEIDDSGGRVVMPPTGAEITIEMGYIGGLSGLVFSGKVDEVRSKGSGTGGRTMTISAKSADSRGKAKQPQSRHMDDKTLEEALREAGRAAGITDIRVDPQLRSLRRAWWGMDAESFISFGERLAREVGGTFKVRGPQAVMGRRNSGQSASGQALSSVAAAAGDNLLDWDISPHLGRNSYREATTRYYDATAGRWRDVRVQVPTEGAQAQSTSRHSASDEAQARSQAGSDSAKADRSKGGGTVTITGNIAAKPEGNCLVIGARPGIDGSYRIDSVDHSIDASGGFTTKLSLKQPSGTAGSDSRRQSGGAAGSSSAASPSSGGGAFGVQ